MKSLKKVSDVELIKKYQWTNEPGFFGELYNRHNQKVFWYCFKITGDRELAMDITQDVFIKIVKKIHQLKEPMAFVKWLFRVAHNESMVQLREKNKRKTDHLEEHDDFLDKGFDEDIAFEKEEKIDHVNLLLHESDGSEKELLFARYFEKKSIADLMKKYHISESAVKMRLFRARKKIRQTYHKEAMNFSSTA